MAAAEKYIGLNLEYDEIVLRSARLVERTLSGDYINDRVTVIGPHTFRANIGKIGMLSLPNATETSTVNVGGVMSSYAFSYMSGIDVLSLPKIATVYARTFSESNIQKLDLSGATTLKTSSFEGCRYTKQLRLPSVTTIESAIFAGTGNSFIALILPGNAVCTLGGVLGWADKFGASGAGYIYVPRALVDSYKAATNWSNYAGKIRALEDYTVDGTVNGELDETKI